MPAARPHEDEADEDSGTGFDFLGNPDPYGRRPADQF